MIASARTTARRACQAAVVTVAVVAGLLGTIGTAGAAPLQPVSAVQSPFKADLVVTGPVESELLIEGGSYYFSTTVENVGPARSRETDARFTFQPVQRVVVHGQTAWINSGRATVLTGRVPALFGTFDPLQQGGERTGFATAFATGSALGSLLGVGFTRVTVCADASNRVPEHSETNNCRSEIVTL